MPDSVGLYFLYFQFQLPVICFRVKRMLSRHSIWVMLVALALLCAQATSAQFTDPRNYQNTPVGVNQVEVAYAYARSNASVDPYIVIEGARLNLNQWALSYTRYFGLFGHTAWVAPGIPLAVLNGSILGTKVNGSVSGAGDTSYEFGMLLIGGRALTPEEFTDYKTTTTVGVSLIMTAPTGLYRPDKVLNLGADRWSFKPEIGVSYPFGRGQRWVLDGYANCSFYTDNTSYHGVQILKQAPLPGFEAHLSYGFGERLVASFDTRTSFRGDTTVSGLAQDNPQKNFVLGSEAIVSLNNKNQ